MICLGPYLVPSRSETSTSSELFSTGTALEFATEVEAHHIPIFRKVRPWGTDQIDIDDLVLHEDSLCFDINYWPHHTVQTSAGKFFPLTSLICALYETLNPPRAVTSLLADFREHFEFSGTYSRREPEGRTFVCERLAQLGFELTHAFSHGRSVLAHLGWSFPQDRDSTKSGGVIHACYFEFRPQPDGTLNLGKWPRPEQIGLPYHLVKIANRCVADHPIRAFSKTGLAFILSNFEWTPLARMTPKEARTARIQFIRKNSSLISDPRKLAEALRSAGLYSENTSISQIQKFLLGLIDEVQN
jgi:hypothetical protein